jgi:hypothetical protein
LGHRGRRPPLGVLNLIGLFSVRGLQDGDEFELEFLVEDGDLVADEVRSTSSVAEPDEDAGDSPLVAATGVPLSTNKRQLMAHIAKLSLGLFGTQQLGTAVLCSYVIRIDAE